MNYENYEDLNNAKKRIISLMQTKYGEEGEEYQESDDTDADSKMNSIITQLNNATSYSFNMIPFIKKEKDSMTQIATGNQVPVFNSDGSPSQVPVLNKNGTHKKNTRGDLMFKDEYEDEYEDVVVKRGNAYYRNVNSLLAFNQQVLNLSNSLTSTNKIFIKLIDNIGYVEPQTLDNYKESYDKYIKTFDQLYQIAVIDEQLKITMKEGDQNEFDRNQLINEFDNARLESLELVKFNDIVRRTYNYKSNNVSKMKNRALNGTSSNNAMHDYDDE
jgi:hypothetical protein